MVAQNIDEVISNLDHIIESSINHNSPSGYFPALYRKVTVAVKEGIEQGRFENGNRMEKLDVVFANRYLLAYSDYQQNSIITHSWKVAFDGTKSWWPIVLQHLLAGMNAHINLDLGIAAAEIAPGDKLGDLHNDFNEINVILSGLINEVQDELAKIWPLLSYLDKLAGSVDERIVSFSMDRARDEAWSFARDLAMADDEQSKLLIQHKDLEVSKLGTKVLHPGILSIIPKIIRLGEKGTVSERIRVLA